MVLVHKSFEFDLGMVDKMKHNHLYKHHHLPEHFVVAKRNEQLRILFRSLYNLDYQ
jgi:hypothetical protein